MSDELPPTIDAQPSLTPVAPPAGSPDAERRAGRTPDPASAPAANAAPSGATAPTAPPLPVERLVFRPGGRPWSQTVPLDYPFEWQGTVIEAIAVRRLTVAEVSDVVQSGDYDRLGWWALYAVQTGLPVGVLRGLDEDDGDRVLEVARDFLPRVFAATLAASAAAASPSAETPVTGAPASPA